MTIVVFGRQKLAKRTRTPRFKPQQLHCKETCPLSSCCCLLVGLLQRSSAGGQVHAVMAHGCTWIGTPGGTDRPPVVGVLHLVAGRLLLVAEGHHVGCCQTARVHRLVGGRRLCEVSTVVRRPILHDSRRHWVAPRSHHLVLLRQVRACKQNFSILNSYYQARNTKTYFKNPPALGDALRICFYGAVTDTVTAVTTSENSGSPQTN